MRATLSLVSSRPAAAARAGVAAGPRPPESDPRWRPLAREIARLRDAGRRAIRIVDADCGDGRFLLAAARQARRAGFVAVEARGIDGSPALVARAAHRAATLRDPAVGVYYEVGDACRALDEEAEAPADIAIWTGANASAPVDAALHRAAFAIVGLPATGAAQ